ncbi:MAG: AraC family transcriptional regulator, partial [Bacteroidota bacterium]
LTNHQSIVSTYPKTQKHFIQQFKKYAGLTPKVFHRIMRFNEILQQIHKKEHIAWSQVAYQFGYTDQSHFIKEFKEFSGFSPEEFIEADHHKDETNFFPLDREG